MSTDAIRARLDAYAVEDPADGDYGDFRRDYAAPEAIAALRAVLDLHKPYRIYEVDCGHQHTDEDIEAGTARDITDVGYVCDDAYQYSICNACCTDDGYGQTEECVSRHPHGTDMPYCGTARVIAEALGVSTEPPQPEPGSVEHPSWSTVAHHSIGSALYTLDHPPLGDRARLVTRMSDQTEWVPCGRDGEPLPAQPTCTCDSPDGPIPHRPECELNHPHHPCDDRSCRYAVPAQAESRVWRVTAVPDGTDTDEIGTLHRERDGRWESWYDDDEGDDGDWYPSDWTGVAEMERYGYTLAEVTDRAGEA